MTTEAAAETRWLSDDEQQAWIGMTAIMWLLPPRLDAQLQRDSGLTLFEYFVLSSLSMAADRRLRMRDLAALANASRSRLSNVVTKLEDQGWITRSVATSDRRGAVAELTEAGWGVVVAAAPGHVDMVRTLIFDQLRSDQVSALRSLGEALAGGPLSGAIEPCGDDSGCVPDDTPC